MSKRSDAKKARRKKRLAARGPRWNPDVADDSLVVDEVITSRGWEFDLENSNDEMVTWYFPPSGISTDDEAIETVTRIWLTTEEEWHVIFVGAGADGIDYVFSAEALLEHLEAIERYRAGDPVPDFE
ncbi:hypothetical protein [Mycolicibacterium litorale]|uniref:Uncharacterized protein n=1 Tax=Mycolicibacterium litorale TaxID=758802 RepID=A0AAD1IMT7_9MYCO|nr:hypothetical protein [Mycolicibacterium litorale]MCV7416823.1 hypothetical protein [Mycolicibacterium litorale]TDY04608.1 hypothetical protein BCL50_3383 [Mycolicibacterium litorale]BBY18034.1 hypothetical protein MLIT_36260 [Mycolicibacterium litorale]